MVSAFIYGGKARCWILLLLMFFIIVPQQICPNTLPQTCVSSCGTIHRIAHPFRLKDDHENCGDKRYELSCINNITVLQLDLGEYHVKAINYNNYTIRVVDPNLEATNCSSLPRYFMYKYNFSDYYWVGSGDYFDPNVYPYQANFRQKKAWDLEVSFLFRQIIYLNCTTPPNDDAYYVDTTSCIDEHTYAIVGDIELARLKRGCHVKLVAATSFWGIDASMGTFHPYIGNVTYIGIHRALAYGVELSWLQGTCEYPCIPGSCYITDTGEVGCQEVRLNSCTYAGTTGHCGFWPKVGAYTTGFLVDILIGIASIVTSRHTPEALYVHGGVITGRFVLPFLMAARFLLVATLLIAVLIYRCRRRHLSAYENIETFLQGCDLMPIRYSYKEIKNIAGGFKNKLGEGGFGSVYKGKLRSGSYVAIKMLGKHKGNVQDFISEVATIGRIHHVNVVQLLGFCLEGSKRALVYEFMSNSSLDKYVFGKEGSIPLSYEKMLEISLNIARGISYLHEGCDMQILHFDIKPHNILLDENFVPKISDFGLAKLYPVDESIVNLTLARGTFGYMAPELFYKNIGGVSYKADVYSFGMLLMEIANRRKNVNSRAENSSQVFFPTWIYDQFSKGNDIDLDDATEDEKNIAKKMIMIALWCIQLQPRDRPSMKQVVEMLEGELESLEMPPKPLLYPPEMPHEDQTTSDDSTNATSFSGETSCDVTLESCPSNEKTRSS